MTPSNPVSERARQFEVFVLRVFGKYITRYKRNAESAMPGWGLQDSVFADELQEIRDKIIKGNPYVKLRR